MGYLLALDAGTSSMRGGIWDHTGVLLWMHQTAYRVRSAQGGRVEQDPRSFLSALEEIAAAAGACCREHGIELAGVGLASQRSSLIAVDENGGALRDAIMWQDKRSEPLCAAVDERYDPYAVCGMRPTPVYTGPKILWLRQNEPDVFMSAYKFLGVHDYLLHRMTGRFVTDESVASRSCMLDLYTRRWSPRLLEAFGAPPEKLCEIVPPGAICGETAPDFTALLGQQRALPVVSAGGDQQCAALGLGVTRACALSINCGTGAYVAAQSENPVLDPRKDVICNCSALPGAYVLEASTMASGMVYDWFVHAVCQSPDYQSADAGAAASPPGAGGVLALPDLMGRGMPAWDGAARGVFYNIGFHTTRGDLARAVLEGLAAGLCACVELMRAAGVDPAEAVCSGGLSKSPLFVQILADMTGLKIQTPRVCEATLRGVWASSAAAFGWYAGMREAAGAPPAQVRYSPDSAAGAVYKKANEARRLLYDALDTRRLGSLLGSVCG